MGKKDIITKAIVPLIIMSLLFFTIYSVAKKPNEEFPTDQSSTEDLREEINLRDPMEAMKIINGVMIFNNENYLINMVELMYNFEDYHGMGVDIQGFVLKPQDLEENSFYLTRYVITCCENDPEMITLNCYYDGDIPEENTWVKIEGSLQAMNYYDEDLGEESQKPLIVVNSLEAIPEPEEHYLEP
ncbi:TIGR03943 family putative permease subunit [Alkaliphilus serpentinus]|uniref:DUF1980 domain-containing protein n=1 Tax=Alkaliphilus serpentinus TaxID=1482731 RepID=A0A833M904_9FIRM|nr:hypothetical protein [Alkaliphilus serpentinus]KAB3528802.1 hypothetical protein F8153_10785 [Alkaliphilus serpentinus]